MWVRIPPRALGVPLPRLLLPKFLWHCPQGMRFNIGQHRQRDGRLAQLAERLFDIQKVTGSSPVPPTSRGSSEVEHFSEKEGVVGALPTHGTCFSNAGVAQLVERLVANEKIAGSNPVSRSDMAKKFDKEG